MSIAAWMRAFLADPAGIAFQTLLVLSFVDFVTGTFAAIRDGTFAMSVIAAFLRKHVIGRAAPILLLLFIGYFAQAPALTAMGGIGAAAYTLELLASIRGNVLPPKDDAPATTSKDKRAEALNPVPVD